jgi:hypothetical protein
MPTSRIIARGLTAAHGALLGALFLFLLHAPVQVMSALAQCYQARVMAEVKQLGTTAESAGQSDPEPLQMALLLSFGSLVFALAMFFLYPLVQGGILSQVRDRIESPDQAPGPFGPYGRAFYVRLLGSLGLFALVMIVIMLPAMFLSAGLAFQQMAGAVPDADAQGAPPPQPLDTQQLTRQLLMHPVMLVVLVVAMLLASAAAMVYWVASSIVVSEEEPVLASWRKASHFCRRNFSAVLAVWLLTFAVSVLISPLSLVGQLGIVKDLWAVAALALLNAALVGYWGVLFAGLTMSLYLARRLPYGQAEPEPAALAGVAGTGQGSAG